MVTLAPILSACLDVCMRFHTVGVGLMFRSVSNRDCNLLSFRAPWCVMGIYMYKYISFFYFNVNKVRATASVCQDCQPPNNDRALTRQEDRPLGLTSLEALSKVQQISIHKPSRPAHLPPESDSD